MDRRRSRREFLQFAAGAAGLFAGAAALPPTIQKALAVAPNRRSGTIQDVEHVVILMQENRSFDHYFGSLRGVRGFADPRPAELPDGRSIWQQPPASVKTVHFQDRGLIPDAPYVLPFYINPRATTEHQAGTDHGWSSGHLAWNQGRWNDWVTQKQDVLTMGYLMRQDVSFHYALADAFTVCDSYFCSVHADTCPNRICLWTGTVDPRNALGAKPNGPGLWERHHRNGYTWTTYPERLEAKGVSWKVYQGGTGEHGSPKDNFTDNSLEFFAAYQVKEGADPQGPLVRKGVANRTLRGFRKDVLSNRLAQVNWIVAPEKYSEHPTASPTDGAYYIHQVLDALVSNPEVWSRTVLFINYDENDGLFDHVAPPMPPLASRRNAQGMVSNDLEASLEDEILNLDRYPKEMRPLIPDGDPGGRQPIGLGPRVPMLVVSPWSRGGWVCSQVFDHTSVLQFLEARFEVPEPNISAWRRAVCGNLTSAFDFSTPPSFAPVSFAVPAPIRSLHQPYSVPAAQEMPAQEPGVRPARALPYDLRVHGRFAPEGGRFWLDFLNSGAAGAAFYVYDGTRPNSPPRRYAVSAGDTLSDFWLTDEPARYQLAVSGPNGYLCQFRGQANLDLEAAVSYDAARGDVILALRNRGSRTRIVQTANAYASAERRSYSLTPGAEQEDRWPTAPSAGWYDLSVTDMPTAGSEAGDFLRRFAGHLETGRPNTSDPGVLLRG